MKTIYKIIMSFVCILVFAESKAQSCTNIMGYYQFGNMNYTNISYEKYNVLLYAFFTPSSNGTIDYSVTTQAAHDLILLGSTGSPGSPDASSLMYKMHNNGISGKVYASIGGEYSYCQFSSLAASSAYRVAFASACTTLVKRYTLDGIDIDWESPGFYIGSSCSVGASDEANFTALLTEIRRQLNLLSPVPKLTFAADPDNSGNIDWTSVMTYADYVNVMSYNYNLPASPPAGNSGHNAPLTSSTGEDWNSTLTLFHTTRGVSLPQLNFGVPFYGYEWDGCSGLGSSYTGGTSRNYNDIIINTLPSSTYHWDNTAKVPYLTYVSGSNVFLSFDDESSVMNKAQFVINNGIHSIFSWDITKDYIQVGSTYLTPLNDKINDVFNRATSGNVSYNSSHTPASNPLPAYTGKTGYIQAGGSPSSYVLVQTSAQNNTSFKSSAYVELDPGFYAPNGTVFNASIISSACTTTARMASNNNNIQNNSNVINNELENNIFPNPTTGKFNLNLNYDKEKAVEVYVYNSLGKGIYNYNPGSIGVGQIEIDLSNESEGIFIVKIKSDNEITYRKIVLAK
jgi:chitinase